MPHVLCTQCLTRLIRRRLRRIKALVLAIASGASEEAMAMLGTLGKGEEYVPPHLEIA